jgi:TetR/AcrR family transcriptional repressor of nem operon
MSPRRADPEIRAGLLAAARDAFLAGGYAAAGLDPICRQAGVTKGALFHHFDGKEGLAGEVLEEWVRAGAEAYADGPHRRARGAIGRALGYVDHTIQLCRRAPLGCLIGTFAQEVAESHPALRRRCERAFREWGAGLAALLAEARGEAPAALPFEPASVADHFIAVFEGAQILAKARGSREVVPEQLRHFRRYLAQLLGVAAEGGPTRQAKRRKR